MFWFLISISLVLHFVSSLSVATSAIFPVFFLSVAFTERIGEIICQDVRSILLDLTFSFVAVR